MTTSEIASSEIPKPERTWAMFAHLSSFLGYTCIPLANIIAAIKANEGVTYRYPLTMRFIK